MARLRRLDSTAGASAATAVDDAWSSIPKAFPGEDPDRAAERIASAEQELAHWFGFTPEILGDLGWLVRGRHIWAHTAKVWPIDHWSQQPHAGSRRVISVGLRAFRAGPGSFETPTSHFLTRWGSQISDSRRFALDRETLRQLLEHGEVAAGSADRGPVALSWEGIVLGRGVVGAQGLRHELGRPHAERLQALLAPP